MRCKRLSNDESIELVERNVIGIGGEALIYSIDRHPDLVAKIYKSPSMEKTKKLLEMLRNPPNLNSIHLGHHTICWPKDILRSEFNQNIAAGFLMTRIQKASPIWKYYNPRERLNMCPYFNYKYLIRSAFNLAFAVDIIHSHGFVIGDLNESNIFLSTEALITIIDTDSFQVTDSNGVIHSCRVGKVDFSPPELQKKSLDQLIRTEYHDRFGLGVLIFLLLAEGFHPFAGTFRNNDEPPAISDRISNGWYPYRWRWRRRVDPPFFAPPLANLDSDLQKNFHRSFQSGIQKPSKRTSAKEWMNSLQNAEEKLRSCRINQNHYFGKHLSRCPWCERKKLLAGLDPFPDINSAVFHNSSRSQIARTLTLKCQDKFFPQKQSGFSMLKTKIKMPSHLLRLNAWHFSAMICSGFAYLLPGDLLIIKMICGTSFLIDYIFAINRKSINLLSHHAVFLMIAASLIFHISSVFDKEIIPGYGMKLTIMAGYEDHGIDSFLNHPGEKLMALEGIDLRESPYKDSKILSKIPKKSIVFLNDAFCRYTRFGYAHPHENISTFRHNISPFHAMILLSESDKGQQTILERGKIYYFAIPKKTIRIVQKPVFEFWYQVKNNTGKGWIDDLKSFKKLKD